jgi:plasmid replication initiation protein
MKEGGIHRGYEITIPEWMYESVVKRKLVLTLDEGYFSILGGLERFLYMFARKASGYNVGGWSEGINSIYEKSGSLGTLTEFKRAMKKILKKENLLGYDVEHMEYPRQSGLYFQRNSALVKLSSEGRQRRGATKWRK